MDHIYRIGVSILFLVVVRCIKPATRSSYTGSVLLIIGTIVAITCRVWLHLVTWWDVLAVVGTLLAWVFIESAVHRFILHSNWRWSWNIPARNHLAHHIFPTPFNGLMPFYHALQFFCAAWILHPFPIAFTVICTLLVLIVLYEIVHYGIHADWAPQVFTSHHMYHHKHWKENFGVTVPWL